MIESLHSFYLNCYTMSSSAEQREHVTEEEIQWTDDKIRWEEDNKAKTNDADHDDESSHDGMIDPFKDPNPLEDTTYRFPNPYFSLDDDEPNNNDDDDNNNNNNKHIEIVLRAYKADSDAIWQSTGLTIWRASEHLCDYLVKHANMFQNKRTLELGAGLGQCSILLQKMTSLCSRQLSSTTTTTVIVVTDGDTDALALLRENIRRNQGSSHTKSKNNASQSIISCHQLLWGRDTSEHFLQRHCDGKTFDIIIASDIIYAKCIIDPLWETIQTLLSPEGIFILAFAKRRVPIQIDFVLQSAEDAGFTFEAIQEDVEGIFVYEFRRKAW